MQTRIVASLCAGVVAAVAVASGGCGSAFTSGNGDGGAGDATSSSSGGGSSSGSGSSGSGSGSGGSSSGVSLDGGCKKGLQACEGNQPIACDGTGWLANGAPCSGSTPACLAGYCVACNPGDVQCSAQQPQKCDLSGAWKDSGPACTGNVCISGACTGVCSPGATRCASATAEQSCGADGQWDTTTTCGIHQPCCGTACAKNDPNNCGSCGTQCLGGNECGNGVCAPPGTCLSCTADVQCEAFCAPTTSGSYCCVGSTCVLADGGTCPL